MEEEAKKALHELAEAYKKYKLLKGGEIEISLPNNIIEKNFIFAGTIVKIKGEQLVLEMIADKLNS